MREMVSQYGVQDDISASALCKFTDVFVVEKEEEDEERELRELLSVVDTALQKHTQMRTAEGAAMGSRRQCGVPWGAISTPPAGSFAGTIKQRKADPRTTMRGEIPEFRDRRKRHA